MNSLPYCLDNEPGDILASINMSEEKQNKYGKSMANSMPYYRSTVMSSLRKGVQ